MRKSLVFFGVATLLPRGWQAYRSLLAAPAGRLGALRDRLTRLR